MSSEVKAQQFMGNRSLQDSRINRSGLPKGSIAPGFSLPRLDGSVLALRDYRRRQVLLVFSDSNCAPCGELAAQLEQLHRRLDRRANEPHILMVLRGNAEDNRAKVVEQGLTLPIVLQRHWEVSKEYGIFATPAGYLIDEQGIIAADLALGGNAILALLTAQHGLQEKMQVRLQELRKELETGQAELAKIEGRRAYLRDTMLRIAGAVQVLEELVAEPLLAGREVKSASQQQNPDAISADGGLVNRNETQQFDLATQSETKTVDSSSKGV